MDVEALLKPISDAEPSGPDLEQDAKAAMAWNDLQTKAESQKIDGVATEPRWPEVLKLALEMAQKWHHLQLGVMLAQCGGQIEGFRGFSDGLKVLHRWCADFWDHVHPVGENQAEQKEMRPPLIEAINHPRFLYQVSHLPLASAHGENFGFADYENAVANESTDPDVVNHARLVVGTFSNTPASEHQASLTAIREALEAVHGIESVFDEKYGVGYGVSLAELRDLLGRMIAVVEPLANSPTAEDGAGGQGGVPLSGGGAGVSGAIASRNSAIAALDKVIDYFEKSEPSSPVPFLLRRAQRCVGMSFMQLIEELAHDRAQAELILKPESAVSPDETA